MNDKTKKELKKTLDWIEKADMDLYIAKNSYFDTLFDELRSCDVGYINLIPGGLEDSISVRTYDSKDYEGILRYVRIIYNRIKESKEVTGKSFSVFLHIKNTPAICTIGEDAEVKSIICDPLDWPPPVRGSMEEAVALGKGLLKNKTEETSLNRQFKASIKLLIENEAEGVTADVYEPDYKNYPVHVTLDPKRSAEWMAATANRIEDLVKKFEEQVAMKDHSWIHLDLRLYRGKQRIREYTSRD